MDNRTSREFLSPVFHFVNLNSVLLMSRLHAEK